MNVLETYLISFPIDQKYELIYENDKIDPKLRLWFPKIRFLDTMISTFYCSCEGVLLDDGEFTLLPGKGIILLPLHEITDR